MNDRPDPILPYPHFAPWFEHRTIIDPENRGSLDYRLAPGNTAEIVNIDVLPRFQRQGIGRAMLERMIAELPPETMTIYAFTQRTNFQAQHWYKKNRFEMTLVKGLYGAWWLGNGDKDAYCCVKQLR